MRAVAAVTELAVQRIDVDRDPLTVAPGLEVAEGDVVCSVAGAQPGVEPLSGLVADVDEIGPHCFDATVVGDRAVARHDRLEIPAQQQVAGVDPVLHRSRPDDRRAFDEQDVAGERCAVAGHVDHDVAAGVGGAYLDEVHCRLADLKAQAALERPRGGRVGDPLELEAAEAVDQKVGDEAAVRAGAAQERRERFRCRRLHLDCRGLRGDDLGAGDEFVAVGVIAVGVRVHQPVDVGGGRVGVLHRVEHLAGVRQVEQRVDEQRLAAADDQPGVAPAPAAIGLQPGVGVVAEVVEAAFVREARCAESRPG